MGLLFTYKKPNYTLFSKALIVFLVAFYSFSSNLQANNDLLKDLPTLELTFFTEKVLDDVQKKALENEWNDLCQSLGTSLSKNSSRFNHGVFEKYVCNELKKKEEIFIRQPKTGNLS